MKRTNRRRLVLDTQRIKRLDPHRLADAAGGGYTYLCHPATTVAPTTNCATTRLC
jgi:hypothetical protein